MLFRSVSQSRYPVCTIEPNLGTVSVPDTRLFELEKLVVPERVLPAVVEIVDIAGLVKGASKGEGLGNQFLANIRECEAIIHVLRCFENGNEYSFGFGGIGGIGGQAGNAVIGNSLITWVNMGTIYGATS